MGKNRKTEGGGWGREVDVKEEEAWANQGERVYFSLFYTTMLPKYVNIGC